MNRPAISRWLIAVIGIALLGSLAILVDIYRHIGLRYPHLALSSRLFPAEQREQACQELLRRQDRSAVGLLVQALSDPEWRVAMEAADSLESLGDRSLIPELLRIARDPTSENGRMYAVSALGRLGDASVVPFLISCLGDPHTLIQRNAAFSLGELKAVDAVDPLIATLSNPSFMYRSSAAMALGMIGDVRALDALVRMLKQEADQHQASGAAEGLGDLGDQRAVPVLLKFIRDERFYVASASVGALGKLKDPSVVPALCAYIQDASTSRDLVLAAVIALGRLGDPQAIPALQSIRSNFPDVIFSRGLLGDVTVRGQLRARVDASIGNNDHDWQTEKACVALGFCGDGSDVPRLDTMTRHPDPALRSAGAEGLEKLRNRLAAEGVEK